MVTKKKRKASKKDESILEKVAHLFTDGKEKTVKKASATVAASKRKAKKAPAKTSSAKRTTKSTKARKKA